MAICLVPAPAGAQAVPAAAPAGPPVSGVPSTLRASAELAVPPAHAPAIGGGRVYLVFPAGQLAAYRTSDAAEIWRIELPIAHPPVTTDGLVLVASGEAVHAFRSRDGSAAWRAETGALTVPPLAHEGWILAASAHQLVALRTGDGSVVWTRDYPPLAARPTIEGNHVYTPLASGRVQALDLRTGRDLWTRRLGGTPAGILALAGRLYVGAADRHFYSLDAGNGTIRWFPRVGAALRGRPAAGESLVYTVSLDNLVRAYDRGHGARTWNASIPYRALAGPIVVGGSLVVAGPATELPVFDAATGRPQAPLVFDAPLVAPLAVEAEGPGHVLAAVVGGLETGWRLVLRDSSYAVPLGPLTAMPGEAIPLYPPAAK